MKKLILTLAIFCLALTPGYASAAEHGGVESVNLTNLSAKVKAGVSFTLTLTAEDEDGNTWDVSENAIFQINDPRGTVEKNIYLPGKVGTWKIEAAYGNYSAQAEIQVIPGAVSKIEINPNSQPEIINLGEKKTFTASAFDSMDNAIDDAEFTWSQEGELGKIDETGVFEAIDTGLGHVIATANDVSGTIEIEVKEKTILPSTAVETETTTTTVIASSDNIVEVENEEENSEEGEDGVIAGLETAKAEQITEEDGECKAFGWYWWLLIMIGYLAVLTYYYFLVRKSKSGWWWFFPLVLTFAVFWIYLQYSCNSQGWWLWVAIIMAIMITLFRPKKFYEEPKEPTF